MKRAAPLGEGLTVKRSHLRSRHVHASLRLDSGRVFVSVSYVAQTEGRVKDKQEPKLEIPWCLFLVTNPIILVILLSHMMTLWLILNPL